jgi:hypothetical protein
MKYMDRRLLFPIAAVTAWAQQPSPVPAEAEAALRARVKEFFQLQVDKKFRQAEALVADDTKDSYYNGNKFNMKTFTIQRIELLDDNTRARVALKAKVTLMMAGVPPVDFDTPSITTWKLEGGKWVWYIETAKTAPTPFGTIDTHSDEPAPAGLTDKTPDLATLQSLVKIDRNSVELNPEGVRQAVTVLNDLPGGVDLELRSSMTGVSTQLEKKHLEAGEKTVVFLQALAGSSGSGVVAVIVNPIGTRLAIHIRIN